VYGFTDLLNFHDVVNLDQDICTRAAEQVYGKHHCSHRLHGFKWNEEGCFQFSWDHSAKSCAVQVPSAFTRFVYFMATEDNFFGDLPGLEKEGILDDFLETAPPLSLDDDAEKLEGLVQMRNQLLLLVLETRLSRYPTSLQEDVGLLEQVWGGQSVQESGVLEVLPPSWRDSKSSTLKETAPEEVGTPAADKPPDASSLRDALALRIGEKLLLVALYINAQESEAAADAQPVSDEEGNSNSKRGMQSGDGDAKRRKA
jgi:hypothetical protein